MPVITAHLRQHVRQLLSDIDQRIEDPERREVLRAILTRTDKVAAHVETEESKINQNPHLTPEGRRADLKKLSAKQVEELKFLRDALGKSNESYRTMSDVLFTVEGQRQLDLAMGRDLEPVESDAIVRHLREREIRDAARLMSQPERDREYLRAVKAGDREIVKALSSSPTGALVTADLKSRADADFAERNFPAAYANYVQISALQEQLMGLSDLTVKWLDALGAQ